MVQSSIRKRARWLKKKGDDTSIGASPDVSLDASLDAIIECASIFDIGTATGAFSEAETDLDVAWGVNCGSLGALVGAAFVKR